MNDLSSQGFVHDEEHVRQSSRTSHHTPEGIIMEDVQIPLANIPGFVCSVCRKKCYERKYSSYQCNKMFVLLFASFSTDIRVPLSCGMNTISYRAR